MGLHTLGFDSDLATTWRNVLTDNQLTVQQDASQNQDAESHVPKRLWRVGDGKQELRILELEYHDRTDGKFGIVFMPFKTRADRQLFLQVQELLIAAGATPGVSGKSKK